MRVGPLSDDNIIDLLSKYFIPAWLSNDHFQLAGPSDAEQEEVQRIYQERVRRRLDSGTVCVVILAPDGSVAATLNLHKAAQPDVLGPFLRQIVDDRKLAPRSAEAIRSTMAAPRPPARPKTEGGLVLHVLTRFEEMKPNRGVSQDWFEWTAAECAAFAPAADAAPAPCKPCRRTQPTSCSGASTRPPAPGTRRIARWSLASSPLPSLGRRPAKSD